MAFVSVSGKDIGYWDSFSRSVFHCRILHGAEGIHSVSIRAVCSNIM
jgi:hypothetical protein